MLFSEIKNWQIIVNKVKLQHVNLNAHHVFGEYAEVDFDGLGKVSKEKE